MANDIRDMMHTSITSNIILIIALVALFGGALWWLYLKKETAIQKVNTKKNHTYIIVLLFVGFIVHIIAAASYYGHSTDMGCFIGWSDRIYTKGLAQFYAEGFHDYPPGYVYIMYILGALKNGVFSIEAVASVNAFGEQVIGDPSLWILIKMPVIIANMVMGYLVYSVASKRFSSVVSTVLAALIILNPTVIVNGPVWGQVDSVLALFCILTVYYSAEKKFIPAVAVFAAGMLIKPQAFFVFPVLAFSMIDDIWFSPKFDSEKFVKHLITGLCGIAAMFVLFMPFGKNPIDGIGVILNQYIATLGQYNYMTVNAFNIFAAAGNNWAALTDKASYFGYVMMALVTIYSGYVYFKSKSPSKHYICAFIIFFGFYMLGVKQHERYAFPGIIMLLYALIYVPKTENYIMCGLFTLSQFFNTAWILFVYNMDINYFYRSQTIITASVINIILFMVCIHMIQSTCVNYDIQEPLQKRKK